VTDETQKLFNAPWTIYGEPDDYSFVIQNASEDEIATVFIPDEAKRISRLPELYDELQRMIHVECTNACERREPCDELCDVVRPAVELLKKVREGK
jgi:hypothetical protein